MIKCPSCSKEIADDSVHCGYCGHQIEEKEDKKTMFGMSALGGEELDKAVEQAKKARKSADEDGEASTEEASKKGGLKLPKPSKKASEESKKRTRKSSGIRLPEPSSVSEVVDEADEPETSDDDQPAEEGAQDDVDTAWAKTERMDVGDRFEDGGSRDDESSADDEADSTPPPRPTPGEPAGPTADDKAASSPTPEESAPKKKEPSTPDKPAQPLGEPAGPGAADEPAVGSFGAESAEDEGPTQFGADDKPDSTGPGGPTPTASGGPAPGGPESPGVQLQHGTFDGADIAKRSEQNEGGGVNMTIVVILGAVVGLGFLGCAVGLVLNFL